MKSHLIIILSLFFIIALVGCSGNGVIPDPPVSDKTPPAWDTTVGVISVVPGDSSVTVEWGTASDAQNPPVEYLVYIDVDDSPWDTIPEIKSINNSHVFTKLVNGTTYWCGVHCRDNMEPPNVDVNSNVISATPEEHVIMLDTTPPSWDTTVGVVALFPGPNSIRVEWGTATDAQNPPVEYLLYSDIDNDLFGEPLVLTTNDPYTFTNLDSGINYHFGVRCRDSADNPNSDNNDNFLLSQTFPKGWSIDWNYGQYSRPEIQIDSLGNIYIMGYNSGDTDYDPGEGHADHDSDSNNRVFIIKLNKDGEFQWVQEIDGKTHFGFCIDSQDNLYLGFESNDYLNIFQKIDGEKNLIWQHELVFSFIDIIVDENDDIYLAGRFWGSVDFDPGDGEDNRTSNGIDDVYLRKFDSSGSFQWVRTWGGTSYDRSWALDCDSNGIIYISGVFRDTIDFDPGPATEFHTSNGYYDAFLSSYFSDGTFRWARTWGGTSNDQASDVAANSTGSVYVSGTFRNTADLDPGSGTETYTALEYSDFYLSRFNSNGSFESTNVWENLPEYSGMTNLNIGFDLYDNFYSTGWFSGAEIDLDQSDGEDFKQNVGGSDGYLSTYDQAGSYLWSLTWGGDDSTVKVGGIAYDTQHNVYVVGLFSTGYFDFDPGPGVDIHASGGSTLYLSKFPPGGYW